METTVSGDQKVINYIEQMLIDGMLRVGDKLPTERELSRMLDISRGSVRNGLAVLEAMGIIYNIQGSGNYVNASFDNKLTQIMTMMYALDGLTSREVCGIRYAAELQALILVRANMTEAIKEELFEALELMETSDDQEVQIQNDKKIHQLIVETCGNRLVIANYLALNKMLDDSIKEVREHVSKAHQEDFERFQFTHRKLVEAVCEGNISRAREALDEHLAFMLDGINT